MKSLPTIAKHEMPRLFHEPYVDKGFRPVHQPWRNYFFSLFQWHNEVMNIWTHLIGLIMVFVRGGLWCTHFDILGDPYMWPLGVAIVTMILLYACSAGAHCFHTRSELAHYVCFMIDYAGIGLYGFGSTMLHYWYCSHEEYHDTYLHQIAIPFGALLGVIVCYCCGMSKVKYERPYPFVRRLWQIGSVTAIYLWLSIPVWMKIGIYAFEGRWEPSFGDHITQTMWFALGGFFFGSDIPQRVFPGKFDFVGHSHQLFHVCIMMTTSEQMDGVYYDITHGMDSLRLEPAPTFLGTWGALIFVLVGNAAVVINFYYSIKDKVLEVDIKETCNGHGAAKEGEIQWKEDMSDAVSHPRNEPDGKLRHRNGLNSNGLSSEPMNGHL